MSAEAGMDSAYVALAQDTLAARLQQLSVEPQIQADWEREQDCPDFHGRVAVLQYTFPQGHESVPRTSPSVLSNTSSMAVRRHSHAGSHSTLSEYEPSLSYGSTAQASSVTSGYASSIAKGGPLDEDGFLDMVGRAVQPPATMKCSYSCLGCNKSFFDPVDWAVHERGHFGALAPPKHLTCPFRCDWSVNAPDGGNAWEARRNHIENMHNVREAEVDCTRSADKALIQWLWGNKQISPTQLKELRTFGRLGQTMDPFTATGGVGLDRRRENRSRRDVQGRRGPRQ